MKNDQIIARFPPSPTGPFHIGNARTALFNYIFVKKYGGKLLFRLEDTDKERSKEEYSKDIIDNLKWLSIDIDFENVIKQSERGPVYKKYIEKMLADGKAYISKEEVKEEGQRSEVIRLKNPNKVVEFEDLIRGKVSVDTTELGDFVIAKSIDEPIYHLAVVIDDYEMGINHIIRGEDGIYNTPRQILIQEAIGAPRPIYAHVPFILNEDKSKLSKRKQGETVSVKYYRESGFLPEAIINFLCFIGWNPGDDRDIMSLEEIIEAFDIKRVQKSGGIFNRQKLLWINKEYMKKLPEDVARTEILKRIPEKFQDKKDIIEKIWKIIFERINVWSEIDGLFGAGEFDFFFDKPKYESELLIWKKDGSKKESLKNLSDILPIIEKVDGEKWHLENIKQNIWEIAESRGKGNVLWPLRVSLSGREKSPDPFVLCNILGKTETLDRIKEAIKKLS